MTAAKATRGGCRPGAGRPRESRQCAVRLSLDLVETLDAIAEMDGVNRSDVIRSLLESAIEALEKSTASPQSMGAGPVARHHQTAQSHHRGADHGDKR